jgi:O-methyltransferase involved in polyketide biosynthesis
MDGDGGSGWTPNTFEIRARHCDGYSPSSSHAGICQMVNIAGLASSAYRLPSPDETIVGEIDMPGVIEYTRSTMTRLGAVPRAGIPLSLALGAHP